MRLDDAIEQLSAIHAQVLRSETFGGYRALPTAATGVLAVAAALLQMAFLPPATHVDFARCWIVLAAVVGGVCATELAVRTLRDPDRHARRVTVLAVAQILPPFAVGGALTAVLLERAPDLLPAVWALCFGLALAASRPFLPRPIGRVTGFYLAAGAVLLLPALRDVALAPAAMGVTFGVGQIWSAGLLRRAEEERRLGR